MTADNMATAAMLVAAAEWLVWEVTVAVTHVRELVRDWRERRHQRALNDVYEVYGIGYRAGAATDGVRP